jgi:plasmid stability protein
MITNIPAEQEARLAALAAREGRSVDDLARQANIRLLDNDARFAAAIEQGIAAADRGDDLRASPIAARRGDHLGLLRRRFGTATKAPHGPRSPLNLSFKTIT